MDKLLGGTGFTLFMVGLSGMDSECMIVPVGMVTVGALLLWLYGYISGEFEQKNSPR